MLDDVVKRAIPFPKDSKILIFGGGFTGQHIAAIARSLGAEVLCSRRNLESKGADFEYDSNKKFIKSKKILNGVTHVISCIPPLPNGEDPVLINLGKEFLEMSLKWVGYLSTTGVYGDCQGNWVSENDTPRPKQLRSIRRLACEQAWEDTGLPVQILRLPGIYGPGRSTLDAYKKKSIKAIDKAGQVFSRIHIDDIAGAIIHLINLYAQGKCPKIINLADNLPASNLEVMEYAAKLLGTELPLIEPFEIASQEMSPMALSFWLENRKISNKILCKSMGYSLIHPDYKSGLKDCLIKTTEQKTKYSN